MGVIPTRMMPMGVWRKSAPPLPYDAEVEYLESTGTQALNTGVNQKLTQSSLSLHIVFYPTYFVRGTEFDIAGTGSGQTPTFGTDQSTARWQKIGVWAGSGTWWTPASMTIKAWHDYHITLSATSASRTLVFDGVTYTTTEYNNSMAGGNLDSIHLFASGPTRFNSRMRISSCQIIRDGVLCFDGIPVRVGSGSSAVGYLFDRVSGTLFGNAGTGAFTIGPDKT